MRLKRQINLTKFD